VLNVTSVCLCSGLSYPTCKTHLSYAALCFRLWLAWLYSIFQHYHIKSTIVAKDVLDINRVF